MVVPALPSLVTLINGSDYSSAILNNARLGHVFGSFKLRHTAVLVSLGRRMEA